MKKISYLQLQKRYAGKLVALNKKEDRVLSTGKNFEDIFRDLKREGIEPGDCVFVGPINKIGTINVYIFPLRKKAD